MEGDDQLSEAYLDSLEAAEKDNQAAAEERIRQDAEEAEAEERALRAKQIEKERRLRKAICQGRAEVDKGLKKPGGDDLGVRYARAACGC